MAFITLDATLKKEDILQLEKKNELTKQLGYKFEDALGNFLRDKFQVLEDLDKTDFTKTEYLSQMVILTKKETIEDLLNLLKQVNQSNPRLYIDLKDLLFNKL
ncbi:hypothetical protein [Flavobacterium phage FPSV-S1]|nr:hypothetical protein [Flavobacterium phage FPSV-S1]QCW20510.1 hypothetical protein [Flavobacterium phage FPSV-S8]